MIIFLPDSKGNGIKPGTAQLDAGHEPTADSNEIRMAFAFTGSRTVADITPELLEGYYLKGTDINRALRYDDG